MVENEEIKAVLNKKIKVLDKGFVELCDVMGDDETVVRCARQSYDKAGGELSEYDIRRQIFFMLENGHTSPFEQVVFRFHIRLPVFVARQLIRHRTARVNELSGRYTVFSEDSFHVPDELAFINRETAGGDKDSIAGEDYDKKIKIPADSLSVHAKYINNISYNAYKGLLDNNPGIPPELARINLPLTLFTELYWQMDLHNLLHFLRLRLDGHAQKEIREYALAIYNFVKAVCPFSAGAFAEFQLNSLVLGYKDFSALLSLIESLYNKLAGADGNGVEFTADGGEEAEILGLLKGRDGYIKSFNKLLEGRTLPRDKFIEKLKACPPGGKSLINLMG
jgi:thymidylate synthase (FAD)